jgi:uncharacterized protein (TIGR02271 family)
MEQCVIGVFETVKEADVAEQNLRAAGFGDNAITSRGPVIGTSVPDVAEEEGGIAGFFRRLFGTEEHPHIDDYARAVERGHSVVIVDADSDDQADRAKLLMERAGAFDVEAQARQWTDTTGTVPVAGATTTARAGMQTDAAATGETWKQRDASATVTGSEKIPVVEEQLQVGKREVQRGGVRIYTRVSEKPVEETVNLKEQTILVERRPVERAATGKDWDDTREREFEVRTVAEEPVVQKSARVVEEVEIGRQTKEHTETVRDSVRKTDVEVEDIDTGKKRGRKPPEGRPNP